LLRTETHGDAITEVRIDSVGQRIFEEFLERYVERYADIEKLPVRQGLSVCG
jgi:hypothetical protein